MKTYLAIADGLPDESFWSITFSDFPGVTSTAKTFASVTRQAREALATAVEDMETNGEMLPASLEDDFTPTYDTSTLHDPRILAVTVEFSGRRPATISEK